jgi:hypothetical protein
VDGNNDDRDDKPLMALTLLGNNNNNNSMTNFYLWKDIIESTNLSDVTILTEDENALLKILCCAIDIEILNKKLGIL